MDVLGRAGDFLVNIGVTATAMAGLITVAVGGLAIGPGV